MEDQDFLDLSSRQEHLMREMNAYLKAIDITDSPGDNSAATMKVTNSQNKTLSSRLRVPPLATITSSSSSSSSSSAGSGDSMNKDSSTTNVNTEVEKKKQGRRRSLTNHLNSIDEHNRSTNGSKISADCYNHIYNEGQKVVYTNSEGSCLAVITKVHYDDELQPYYTIEIEGREKQTDNNHLSRLNESEYEYFNEANTTASSSQFEDDSLVAMAKRMDDSQTIISDPSLLSCGTKEKTLLTLPNLPNITKKLGINKGKQPTSSPEKDSPLHSDDEDVSRNIPSDSSSSGSVEVFDYNGMTREQVMSMKQGRNSPSDVSSVNNEEGRRSRGGTGKKKNGKTHHSRRHHRSPTEERRKSSSRHRSSSRSRRKRRDKERKRRRHKHDDDDESMHGIGFNTRVKKSDIDDGRRRTAKDERPIQQSQQRRQGQHHTNTKNQIDDDRSEIDEHSTYDSDDCTQIFYESTDDEWRSADSEEEKLVAIGTSVTDAVNNLNKKRGVKSLFGLR